MFREFIRSTDGLKARLFGPGEADRKLLEDFTKAVYECTTCGACGQNCPVGIFTQRLWPTLRKEMVKRGLGPIGVQANLPKAIKSSGNPYDKPAADRYRPWFPEQVKVADRADIAYYAGCTGAYEAQPMVRGDVLVLNAIGDTLHHAAAGGGGLLRLPALHHGPARPARRPGQAARGRLRGEGRKDAGLLLSLLREHHEQGLARVSMGGSFRLRSGISPSSLPARSRRERSVSRRNLTRP